MHGAQRIYAQDPGMGTMLGVYCLVPACLLACSRRARARVCACVCMSRLAYTCTHAQTDIITCYVSHDTPTATADPSIPPSIHPIRSTAGQYRFELAKLYLLRRRDATDWEAAFLLLDQTLEVVAEEESRITVGVCGAEDGWLCGCVRWVRVDVSTYTVTHKPPL